MLLENWIVRQKSVRAPVSPRARSADLAKGEKVRQFDDPDNRGGTGWG